MKALRAGLFEFFYRLREGAPKFFKRFQAVAAAIFALSLLITEKFPELNPVVFVFNKGEVYQDIVRLMTVIGAFNLGIITVAQFPLRDQDKRDMLHEKKDILLEK